LTFDGGWRNSHIFSSKKGTFVRAFSKSMYIQHVTVEELQMQDPKLWQILEKYGEAFDDYWFYWISKGGKYVRRTPLWLSQKYVPCEKPRKYEPNRKLTEFPSLIFSKTRTHTP